MRMRFKDVNQYSLVLVILSVGVVEYSQCVHDILPDNLKQRGYSQKIKWL